MNLETGESSGVGAGGIKARNVYFASPDFAILRGSETTRRYTRNKYEVSGAFSFDLKTRKVTQLGKDVEDLYPAQSGYGRIVGLSDDGKYEYMPGFVGQLGSDPAYDLLRVRLDRSNGRVHSSGRHNTIDWFVARDGRVLAREDLDPRRENYRLYTEVTGKLELVYEDDDTKFVPFSVVGILPDETGVVIIDRGDEEEFSSVRVLNFDGTMGRSLFTQSDRGIEYLLTDENRYVVGAKFRGETPTYSFLDPAVDSAVATLVSQYNGLSVDIYDWTADFANILVRISGGGVTPKYYFYKPGEKRLSGVVSAYEGIEDGDVGTILQIQYKAEDGLTIPAIVTLPPGMADPKNMPMIVMPHGGPASYDRVGFDWMAQYFASRGYLVFQPNFRGSTGYGISFRDAGDGEWGGKMQDDITDGVNLLTRNGWADANRVCIIGGSYGGYAALAGGFLTPDLYKCVGAIAPVADLDLMLKDVKSDRGKHSTTYAYWSRLIGDRREDRAKNLGDLAGR